MKNFAIVIFVIITGMLMMSCNQNKTTAQTIVESDNGKVLSIVDARMDNKAYVLMKNNCFICHNAGTGHETMIAPPMLRVKEHYMDDDVSKAEFIESIKRWVADPSEDKIQMPGAVDKFKIMPKLFVEKADMEAIAGYMYDNELDGPSWWGEGKGKDNGKGKGHGHGHGDKSVNDGTDEMGHGWKKEMKLDEDGSLWKANLESTIGISKMKRLVSESLALKVLNQKEVSKHLAKEQNEIIKNCSMKGASHDNLHIYLQSIGEKIDKLAYIENERMARIIIKKIDKQLSEYSDYFK